MRSLPPAIPPIPRPPQLSDRAQFLATHAAAVAAMATIARLRRTECI